MRITCTQCPCKSRVWGFQSSISVLPLFRPLYLFFQSLSHPLSFMSILPFSPRLFYSHFITILSISGPPLPVSLTTITPLAPLPISPFLPGLTLYIPASLTSNTPPLSNFPPVPVSGT
eukprot:sb/3476375/